MVCTEVALCRLAKSTTKHDLKNNDTFVRCLRTVSQQPDCLGVTWDVLAEDSTMLVWLAEWTTRAAHAEHFVDSEQHKQLEADFSTFLEAENPLVAKWYYDFDPSPSKMLSPRRPTLELMAISLNEAGDYNQFVDLLKPITETYDNQARLWSMKRPNKGEQTRLMLIVAWESIEEHKRAKYSPNFQACYKKAKTVWKNVDLFGHITPA